MLYEGLVKALRNCSDCYCGDCKHRELLEPGNWVKCTNKLINEAADAIEELLKAAKAMHTWIFLNSADEQAAYDECGLSDEMNAVLGYGGQFVVEPPKDGE